MADFLAKIYERKLAGIWKILSSERREYCTVLERAGFTVESGRSPGGFAAAGNLVARKGDVVLEVSQPLRGRSAFSVSLKGGTSRRTVRLSTNRLDEAIAFADTAQYLA
jgi:hypothetical protein